MHILSNPNAEFSLSLFDDLITSAIAAHTGIHWALSKVMSLSDENMLATHVYQIH